MPHNFVYKKGFSSRFTLYAPERSDVNNFHLRTAPNLSGRHDRKLYGKTGIMQDNFSLYPEVQPSTGICQRTFTYTNTHESDSQTRPEAVCKIGIIPVNPPYTPKSVFNWYLKIFSFF